ncbi:unnamed protein product [Prorocentrum cordatum]|uniref:Protein C10 n=1 Tax=Prorocentrum cordatum TaxID=2364126 RepID=A0ABN9Y676_9DINO|nr:unnamed protein product [Polarella glacialis]
MHRSRRQRSLGGPLRGDGRRAVPRQAAEPAVRLVHRLPAGDGPEPAGRAGILHQRPGPVGGHALPLRLGEGQLSGPPPRCARAAHRRGCAREPRGAGVLPPRVRGEHHDDDLHDEHNGHRDDRGPPGERGRPRHRCRRWGGGDRPPVPLRRLLARLPPLPRRGRQARRSGKGAPGPRPLLPPLPWAFGGGASSSPRPDLPRDPGPGAPLGGARGWLPRALRGVPRPRGLGVAGLWPSAGARGRPRLAEVSRAASSAEARRRQECGSRAERRPGRTGVPEPARFVPDAIASSPRFRHYRTFTGSLSPFGAGRGKCMGAVAPDGEASCDLVDVRPQPDALQSTAWATPVAPPATKAACPPRLGRAAALEMADAFVVEFSALSFQQALREACQEAHGDLRREVRQRRSLCDPIRFRVISKYGFPPDPVGVCQCSAAFAELLPDDKELQELNWKLSALLQTRPQDWDTQFAPLCSDMTLDCEPPAPPNLSPLRPIVDPVGWERPGAVTNVVR